MTEEEITKEFLSLFSRDWNDPAAHQGFRELRELVAGQGQWPEIVHARLMALEQKTADSIALLREILAREPLNFCASLLLASILSYDISQPEEAITIYDSLLHQGFQDEVLPDWLQALTLFKKGVTYGEMGKFEEAIRVCNEVIERFGDSSELALRQRVARALFNKGVVLGEMGKYEEAIRVYDEVVERFGDSSELGLREEVAQALFNKGATLGEMGKSEEEILVYGEVVGRFGDSVELALQEEVAQSLVNKGVTLEQLGKSEEAIRVYDEVIERYGDSSELPLREQVANAILYKVECLLDADRANEAQDLFKTVEQEYLGSEDLRSKLASYYTYLRSRFASRGKAEEGDLGATALEAARKTLAPHLMGYLTEVLRHVDRSKQEEYFSKMKETKRRTDGFIRDDSRFLSDASFLLVLREWNSYTPVIPGGEESDRGGGYFIRHAGEGIVIDPGYDFIENFYRAGGLLCDIDHVIVTHAHDDHTAELEALVMLLQRRWTSKDLPNRKPVSLYLSAGVQRKFAGLLDLRDPKYRRVVTLCPAAKGFEQRVPLNAETDLTVLPAYHDDVITENSAVGLAFEFATKNGMRRVVFTGDSGLYPLKLGEYGKKRLYDDNEDTPMLQVGEGKALYERYPEKFRKPDLLVAHIGSIKESEFSLPKATWSREDQGRWYYVNHLGLLGTLTMLHQLNPEAAVISEFGSELKGFHFDLVDKLQQALHALQAHESPESRSTFVIPGDLTIAYDIANHRFLCHETCEFADPLDLSCRPALDCPPKWNRNTKRYDASAKEGTTRIYLFKHPSSAGVDASEDNRHAEDYCRKLFNHELPYHKRTE